ncbi:MAG: caspase family protein [Bacteroidales bacterium]|jgi:TolB-like protein/Flp pilus assembly protein TadD|nr:caspase family protein [Bacteroidales bacterium]
MKKIIVALATLLFCYSVNSQERRLALVIGNGNYTMSTLRNPENDAKSMEIALEAIGFEVIRHENLRQKELARAIDDFGNSLVNYDVGLFFYAGHGVQSKGFNYLIPVDAVLNTESDVEYNCVRADRVLGKMEDAKNNINIIILDACRDNPYERSWTRAARGRGLASITAPVGSVIAYATSPGSTASDGHGKNGLFTSGMLEYVNEPGITAIQMFQKVTAFVHKNSSGNQLPWVSTSLTGDFFLVSGTGKVNNTIIINNQKATISNIDNTKKRSNSEISIAVLPFSNLTGNSSQDYLVKGQQDALNTELCKLSQVKPLRVVGGRTVNALSNDRMSIPEIAQQVNVDFLVEASVVGSGDSITLQVRLIQAFPEERAVWARTYSSDMSNILKLQNNIAGQIAIKLDLKLTTENLEKLPVPRQVNPESYKAYLRGMYNVNQLKPETIKKGLEYLHEAIRIDPADPFAYAGLALGYLEIAHGPLDAGDALVKAEAAAFQAFKIDSSMAEVYAALAEVYLYQLWEFEKADKYFRRAIELNPNLDIAHYHYAWALYLFGRMEEAIVEHKLAQKYDPFNPLYTSLLGALYCYDGRYEDAIKEANKSFEIQKDNPFGLFAIGEAYLAMGKEDEAIEAHEKLAQIAPWFSWPLGYTYAVTNHRDEAEKILNNLETSGVSSWNAVGLSVLYGALGKNDEAFKWLSYEPHHVWVPWASVMPIWKPLHDDPRYEEFVNKLNIPKQLMSKNKK